MARVLKTDYASQGYPHREHTSKKTRRPNHRRRREKKIMMQERRQRGERKRSKFKNKTHEYAALSYRFRRSRKRNSKGT